MPSWQINDFLPKGNRKKLSQWPDLNLSSGSGSLLRTSGARLEVLVLPIPGQIVKELAGFVDFEDEQKYKDSVKSIADKYLRHR